MARSGGITFSAVIVFLGSAIIIVVGGLMAIGLIALSFAEKTPEIPPFAALFGVLVLMFAGLAVWGITSGVGLIKCKEWARLSMIVFSCFLILLAIPGGLTMAFLPYPHSADPDLPQIFFTLLRIGTVAFYGALALLGGVWIYFFNKKNVKAQFGGQIVEGIVEGVLPATGAPDRRPVSIMVIGWYFVISAALIPVVLPLIWRWFSRGGISYYFLGFFVFGREAFVLFAVWWAAIAVAGVGLLKLKNWARLLGVWLQVLGILNAAMLIAIPADRARFEHIMNTFTPPLSPISGVILPPPIPTWIAMAGSFPVLFVILWFLLARKNAFLTRASEVPSPV
ncbi:MAG: hypothetical protein ACRD4M_12650 [Candidatus Acidiferrales bacterium]